MPLPSWVDAPFTWDTLIVAGGEFPGLAHVDAGREYTCDKKRSAGSDGYTLTGLGHMPAEVKVTLRLWNTEQFNQLQKVLPKILPLPHKSKPAPVDVSHPALALYGIKSLYFTKVRGPTPTAHKDVVEMELTATEYLPTRVGENVTATPKASTADLDSVPVADGLLPKPPSSTAGDTGPT